MKKIVQEALVLDASLLQWENEMLSWVQRVNLDKKEETEKIANEEKAYQKRLMQINEADSRARAERDRKNREADEKINNISIKLANDKRSEENTSDNAKKQIISNINSRLYTINNLINKMPKELISEANKSASPLAVDEKKINEVFKKANDTGFWVSVKRLLNVGGYSKKSKMLRDLSYDLVCVRLYYEEQKKKELYQVDTSTQGKIQGLENASKSQMSPFLKEKTDADKEYDAIYQRCISDRAKAKSERDNIIFAIQKHFEEKNKESLNQTRIVKGKIDSFFNSTEVKDFNLRINEHLNGAGKKEEWESYCGKGKEERYKIGYISYPTKVKSKALLNQMDLENSVPFSFGQYHLPMVANDKTLSNVFIQYDEGTKQKGAELVQFLILQKLRALPFGELRVDFVDPVERGATLGNLNASFEENEKIGIKVTNSQENISALFKELVEQIDKTTGELGVYQSVYEYNQSNKRRIKERMVVIFDLDKVISQANVSYLKVIWDNAYKCGISVVLCSSLPYNQLSTACKGDLSFLQGGKMTFKLLQGVSTITLPNGTYGFAKDDIEKEHTEFLQNYRNMYSTFSSIDNLFENYHNVCDVSQLDDGTDGLCLDLLLENRIGGELYSLDIGKSGSTHTLITGITDSGKSYLLHTIISMIAAKYHPDDVEMWLLDYGKTEFKPYLEKRPKHIRIISLEGSYEVTKSFLEFLHEFFKKRIELFKENNVSSIAEYRRIFGKHSMPRVVLIVDEFHEMTQHTQKSPELKIMLENALAEYRKYGFSCIFANQTVDALTRGLTDTARKQIGSRIAMKNHLNEIKNTLEISNDNYTNEIVRKMERAVAGDVWYKNQRANSDSLVSDYKALYLKKDKREIYLDNIIARNDTISQDTFSFVINGLEREELNPYTIEKCVSSNETDSVRLCLGNPIQMKEHFYIDLHSKHNQNVLLSGQDKKNSFDVLASIVQSSKYNGCKTVVLADRDDEMYKLIKSYQGELFTKNVEIIDSYPEICKFLKKNASSNNRCVEKMIVIWLGIGDIYDEFVYSSPSQYKNSRDEFKSSSVISLNEEQKKILAKRMENRQGSLGISFEDIGKSLDFAARKDMSTQNSQENDDTEFYNASGDMIAMLGKCRMGVYNVVVVDSCEEIRRVKGFDPDRFVHKISTLMPVSWLKEMGYPYVELLDINQNEINAIYYNQMQIQGFKPYKLK